MVADEDSSVSLVLETGVQYHEEEKDSLHP